MTTAHPAAVVVLAAGAGTRMRSAMPKVLHPLAGRTILGHALAAAGGLRPNRTAVVVRHERDLVSAEALSCSPDAMIVDQDDIPGTGRAVQCALSSLDAAAQAAAVADAGPEEAIPAGVDGAIVVLAGDIPLLNTETLAELLGAHHKDGNAVTVLTTNLTDATGYGRIVRDPASGDVVGIVEHRDASPDQLAITEINSSVYVFEASALRSALAELNDDNAQGEVYLTDVLEIARSTGGRVRAVRTPDPMLVEGVNDRAQLSVLRRELNDRVLDAHMRAGVTIIDPATTWIDVDVTIAADVTIAPGTQLHGATSVATGACIGPDTTLTDCEIGEHAQVVRTHGSLAVIGPHATVGPFAYLRPGTRLGTDGKIGAFVEVKNASIGEGAKVPHLSYVGDATVGEHTNIGAGTIFVNYDGVAKHRTTVGAFARTGAHNMFVAPITIGDGAYTGAGSVIRKDVPAGNLGVSGGTQRNIAGWVDRRRPGSDSAAAAALAHAADPQSGDGLSAQARLERENDAALRSGSDGASAPTPATPASTGSATSAQDTTPYEGDSAR